MKVLLVLLNYWTTRSNNLEHSSITPTKLTLAKRTPTFFSDFMDKQVQALLEWAESLHEEYGQDDPENRST